MTTPATGTLFYEGRAKPLSTTGAIQPGAYYQFYLTGTLTLTNVYADGGLTTPLSQTPGTGGTTAASDGRLVPIYMDPTVVYRVQLYSALGVLLEDIDPFMPVPQLTNLIPAVDNTFTLGNATHNWATVYAVQYISYNQIPYTNARFFASELVTDHAHYAFLDNSILQYAGGAPIYGHASFADNITMKGSVNSDHHSGFQSIPQFDSGASFTLNRLSGFHSSAVIAGSATIAEFSHFRASDPTFAGTTSINNHYGLLVSSLTHGANNWGVYVDGQLPCQFTGPINIGTVGPTLTATIQYDYTSGNLQLIPRTGFDTHILNGRLLIGGGSVAFAANISNDPSGTLIITPRNTFGTKIASAVEVTGIVTCDSFMKLASFTVAGVPSPTGNAGAMVYISNESGGATPAFSDGTNWRRTKDLAIIS